MPKALACSFISWTKRSTFRLRPQGQRHGGVVTVDDHALIRSSTGTFIFGSMNMREPGIFQARSLTGRVWVRYFSSPKPNTR